MSESLMWADVDRHRLVRLCALISGSWAAAEDLAQETLLEAYRNEHKLHDASGRERWLAAVARNVCLRWRRSHSRQQAEGLALTSETEAADPFDIEVELENRELAALLDRALALLPETVRNVLVQRYIDETPPAEIAHLLGISSDAVSMRISRGKLMLRRVLETELYDDAEAFGYVRPADAHWRRTSVWCPHCGAARLEMSTSGADGSISLRCDGCLPGRAMLSSYYAMSNPSLAALLEPVARPTSIVSRAAGWVHDYFLTAAPTGRIRCSRCGRSSLLRPYRRPEPGYRLETRRGIYVHCDSCGEEASCSLGSLALSLPQVRTFRKQHKRIVALPTRMVERAGRPTLVMGFAATASGARVDVLMDDETLEVRGVHPVER